MIRNFDSKQVFLLVYVDHGGKDQVVKAWRRRPSRYAIEAAYNTHAYSGVWGWVAKVLRMRKGCARPEYRYDLCVARICQRESMEFNEFKERYLERHDTY